MSHTSVLIIGEIGINHNGSLAMAKQMIRNAKNAGCDAVKFQKRTIDLVYSEDYLNSYRESPWGTTQREQKEGLEFGTEEYQEIDQLCKELGIDWFASAWDLESQRFLRQFDLKYNKIASAMLGNGPLLKMVAEEGKKTFISTGMSTWEEIDAAVAVFQNASCPFELMHCNSTYPMREKDANLLLMDKLKERYGVSVGYSGHEQGVLVSIAAVAHGASAVERHVTLDKELYGTDQKSSISFEQLKELVDTIRRIEVILGNGIREMTDAEKQIRKKLRGV